MLVLSRKTNESIVIDGGIRISVIAVYGSRVRLGIEAPDSVRILRSELLSDNFTFTVSGQQNDPADMKLK